MMKRREFLRHSVISSLALSGIPHSLVSKDADSTLTILHTNDMHSRIEPFPSGSRFAGLGGMARRASLIEKVRNDHKHLILLDSGDIFQGTPYFNLFGGEVEFRLMSQMKYDLSTIGNHDFDAGLKGLQDVLPYAKFQFVSSNYDFSKTILRNEILPFKVIKRGRIKIGVFGLGIRLENLVSPALYGETTYLDPIPIARDMVEELKLNKGCDLIICLSHLGYQYTGDRISDIRLAREVSGIDLILGGHTHTFLDSPTVVKNPEGHETVINQVGFAGIRLGMLQYRFSGDAKILAHGEHLMVHQKA